MQLIGHLAYAFTVTAPILVVLFLGALFKQKNWVDGHFVEVGNRLLYRVCMPSLLFLATAAEPISPDADMPLVLFGVAATFVWCAVLTWIILKLIDVVIGLRVDSDEETQGLDIVLHDETGYNL